MLFACARRDGSTHAPRPRLGRRADETTSHLKLRELKADETTRASACSQAATQSPRRDRRRHADTDMDERVKETRVRGRGACRQPRGTGTSLHPSTGSPQGSRLHADAPCHAPRHTTRPGPRPGPRLRVDAHGSRLPAMPSEPLVTHATRTDSDSESRQGGARL